MDVLVIENLVKYFGGLIAVDHLNVSFSTGEIVGLIGPNGAGKTTLFNLITGTFSPDQGKIIYKGKDISGLKPHATCRRGIGRTFQVPRPFSSLKVFDNVLVACFPKSRSRAEAQEKSEELLRFVGLHEKKAVLAKHLTLVDRKALEMAKALASDPTLLLLDEVMAGLNEKEANDTISLINRIAGRKIGIVVIEHIFKVIIKITNRVIVLDHGKKIAEGDANSVMNDENVIKAYFGEDYAVA
ncbi:MAG: ABC transporter ATP-binding protein [Deltaproteobacteria bacterium]|nr:ABC transporter ATP-binding protein [Deltaproteobacteria bacterium]MBW2119899.1 ABC transporter ATP-binding protein [Deltaproteobacteria bacterium]MBW2344586.1 ABC transporter ATP-binding protein [Deltaproteobacteria bacterium]